MFDEIFILHILPLLDCKDINNIFATSKDLSKYKNDEFAIDFWLVNNKTFIELINYERKSAIKLYIKIKNVSVNDLNILLMTSVCSVKPDVEMAKIALDNGANVHVNDDDLLCRSILQSDDINIIKLLIENGANIHAQNDKPLQYVIHRRKYQEWKETLKLLIENSKDKDAQKKKAIEQLIISSTRGFNSENGYDTIEKIHFLQSLYTARSV